MHTLIRKEETSVVEIYWERQWDKKAHKYKPLPHKPIKTNIHKVVYTDFNGNYVSKGYQEMVDSVKKQLDFACEGLDAQLVKTYCVKAVEVLKTNFSIVHTDESLNYVGPSTGNVRVLSV